VLTARKDIFAVEANDELSGTYWTPATEAEADEMHPRLLEAVNGREGLKLYAVNLFLLPEGAPNGYLDIAIDPATKEACGLYSATLGLEEFVTGPIWFAAKGDVEETIYVLVSQLETQGAL
jgi:hypothetical protein